MKVWLDDERTEPEGWIRTYNVEDTITHILNGATHISLDNDLGSLTINGGEEGWHVLRWLEEYCVDNPDFEPPVISIHTSNPVAMQRMRSYVETISRRHQAYMEELSIQEDEEYEE